MKDKIGAIGKVCSVLAVVGIIVFSLYNRHKNRDGLVNNGILLPCHVVDCSITSKSNVVYFSYTFAYHNKLYDGKSGGYYFRDHIDYCEKFKGKAFPLLVDTTDVTNTCILLNRKAFADYGHQYPDTLKWVSEYIK